MADPTDTQTETPEVQGLDALAKAIGDTGQAEDATTGVLAGAVADLSKGVVAGLTAISAMLTLEKASKGKGDEPATSHLNEDRGGKAKPTPPGHEKGNDEDEGAPGFPDMEMADPDAYLNVEELVDDLAKGTQTTLEQNRRLHAMVKAQDAKIDALTGQLDDLRALLVKATEAQAQVLGPLAKGVQDTMVMLGNLPEAPVGARPTPRARQMHNSQPKPPAAGHLGGNPTAETRLLAKAMGKGIVSDGDVSHYRRQGVFVTDETTNLQIRQRIEALA